MSFNKAARKAFADRKAQRYSWQGREMECRVEKILHEARENGQPVFLRVVYHLPHSVIDRVVGADFTVEKLVDGRILRVSFGISISQKSCQDSKAKHPDILQLHFPLGISDKRIIEKVEELFCEMKYAQYLEPTQPELASA